MDHLKYSDLVQWASTQNHPFRKETTPEEEKKSALMCDLYFSRSIAALAGLSGQGVSRRWPFLAGAVWPWSSYALEAFYSDILACRIAKYKVLPFVRLPTARDLLPLQGGSTDLLAKILPSQGHFCDQAQSAGLESKISASLV